MFSLGCSGPRVAQLGCTLLAPSCDSHASLSCALLRHSVHFSTLSWHGRSFFFLPGPSPVILNPTYVSSPQILATVIFIYQPELTEDRVPRCHMCGLSLANNFGDPINIRIQATLGQTHCIPPFCPVKRALLSDKK